MQDSDFTEVSRHLERQASAGAGDIEPLLISISVSLKRIADRLELNSDTTESKDGRHHYGEFRVSDGRA